MLDLEKFVAYCKPGPRYTSYPTANEFREDFAYAHYVESLNATPSAPLSLYVHLPFCRSACYFCGCNSIYTSNAGNKTRYIDYLGKELALLRDVLDTRREVVQLHFGGGTPTFMSPEELDRILTILHATFPNFAPDSENSCEVDPRFFSAEHMRVLRKWGTNRLSFGVQDFDSNVQQAIHRIQSVELVASAVALARENGIASINFDLIYGLPRQNLPSFMQTLQSVVELAPDRLAVFNYAHVPWIKKTMRKINELELPTPAQKLQILQQTIAFLSESGFRQIGMDHFAKPEDDLFQAYTQGTLRRNFQGYTTKQGSQTIGIGLTSIGEGEAYYAQNYKDMAQYESAIDAGRLPLGKGIVLSDEDRLRKRVIMQLMSNLKLSFADIERAFPIDFASHFAPELSELAGFEGQGLLVRSAEGIAITKEGTLLVRNIVMPFDSFLKNTAPTQRKFSKTI
ncbi:MAG: oxygen-independent coproporphyrinogen III oxidase [Helicobacter sp.]|nr:oxygen-independent coproporphyrinogen III oxidase [Helicobacter sp.]